MAQPRNRARASRPLVRGVVRGRRAWGRPDAAGAPPQEAPVRSASQIVVRGKKTLSCAIRAAMPTAAPGSPAPLVALVIDVTPNVVRRGEALRSTLARLRDDVARSRRELRVTSIGKSLGAAVKSPDDLDKNVKAVLKKETPIVNTMLELRKSLASLREPAVAVYLCDWRFEDDYQVDALAAELADRKVVLSVVGTEAAFGRAWTDGSVVGRRSSLRDARRSPATTSRASAGVRSGSPPPTRRGTEATRPTRPAVPVQRVPLDDGVPEAVEVDIPDAARTRRTDGMDDPTPPKPGRDDGRDEPAAEDARGAGRSRRPTGLAFLGRDGGGLPHLPHPLRVRSLRADAALCRDRRSLRALVVEPRRPRPRQPTTTDAATSSAPTCARASASCQKCRPTRSRSRRSRRGTHSSSADGVVDQTPPLEKDGRRPVRSTTPPAGSDLRWTWDHLSDWKLLRKAIARSLPPVAAARQSSRRRSGRRRRPRATWIDGARRTRAFSSSPPRCSSSSSTSSISPRER